MSLCPKTVDSPNTVLQKITGGIFCTQFVQCNDGGAGDKCTLLSVFTYSSNLLTQIFEIVQLTSPKTVDSPNTVLQKITGGIFSAQFVQCNDDGAGDKCMFLSVFTYSSNPLTQICEIVQLIR